MPELPEVETVKSGLLPFMKDQVIKTVIQNRPNLRVPFPQNLKGKLEDKKITDIRRRAKYLLIDLEDNNSLIVHLGMSGAFKIVTDNMAYESQKHDHLVLDLISRTKIIFNDPRHFGMVMYHPTKDLENHSVFINMGVEPLGSIFTPRHLHDKLQSKKSPIKTALLDQRVVAGLGNIYVCEALYQSGISPKRPSHKVSLKECKILVLVIKEILERAISAGGSSLKDYKQADGSLGYFQHHFSVYGKEGEPCPDCDCDLSKSHGIKRIVQSGRSSFFCAQKQT